MLSSKTEATLSMPRRDSLPGQGVRQGTNSPHGFALTLALVGIFSPPVQISLGGAILTPGRAVTIFFLLPAFLILRRRSKKLFAADLWIFLTSAWCLFAVLWNDGFRPYAAIEILELFGGYMIGRAYVFGPTSLQTFIKIVKRISLVLILLACLDTLSGRRFTAETVAHLFSLSFDAGETQYRNGIVRATATFPVAELFGLFCVVCTSLFLYSERRLTQKVLFAGLGIFGTVLSVSSGPILALAIVLGSFCYGVVFRKVPSRWRVLRNAIIGALLVGFLGDVIVLGNDGTHAILWIVRNFTFDPWTGYWRVETWQHALRYILAEPFTGMGFSSIADPNDLFLRSIDSVYLVIAWRFGLPAVFFLIAAIISSVAERRSRIEVQPDSYMSVVRTGFSLAIVAIAVIGLTVHLWDSTWIFWSMCMGVRVSIKEYRRMTARGVNRLRSESRALQIASAAS
jgi:hypothetical protein